MAIDTKEKRMSALQVGSMPWEWGDSMIPDLMIDQEDRQMTVNVYSGIMAQEPPEVGGCKKWGTFKWGTEQWCRAIGLRPFRSVFEEFGQNYTTNWNLQSPDTTIWTHTLTSGSNPTPVATVVSSSGTKSEFTPIFAQTNPWMEWAPSVDNTGVIVLTGASNDGMDYGAATYDDNAKVWYWYVDRHGATQITDNVVYLTVPYFRRVQFELTYIPTSQAKASSVNKFIIGRTGVDVGRRIPADWLWHVPEVDFVQHTRTAIELTMETSSEFNVRQVVARVQTKKHKRRR
jgi:hypothetical protein